MIIAECGINHFGNMEIARELIRQAKLSGADYAKFQLYDVDRVFPNKRIMARGINWYESVKPTQLTKEEAKMLFDYGNEMGIEVFFSVFDAERIKWCEEIGVKRYKIAYSQWRNLFLWEHLPNLIISAPYKIKNKTTLYCIPKYPTQLKDLKFNSISFSDFDGFSDHTIGIEASMIALSRGARIIEKHFCLTRERDGSDIPLSITPSELKQLVDFAKKVYWAL